MKEPPRISPAQLACLFLASRFSRIFLIGPERIAGLTVIECFISTVIGSILTLLLLLPMLALYRHGGRQVLFRNPVQRKIIGSLYAAVSLLILCMDMLRFSDFAAKSMKADFPISVLTLSLIIACFLAAFYGVQTLARAAFPILIFSVFCLLVFGFSLIPEIQLINFPPCTEGSLLRIVKTSVADLPLTAETVSLGLLVPYVKSSATRTCTVFCGLTGLFTLVAALTAIGVLGDFATISDYPYYSVVTAAQIGVIQRLDVLLTTVWVGTFFIRFSLFAWSFMESTRRVFGRKYRVWTALSGMALTAAFSFLMQEESYAFLTGILSRFYPVVVGFVCLLLPVFVLRPGKRRTLA